MCNGERGSHLDNFMNNSLDLPLTIEKADHQKLQQHAQYGWDK